MELFGTDGVRTHTSVRINKAIQAMLESICIDPELAQEPVAEIAREMQKAIDGIATMEHREKLRQYIEAYRTKE